MGSKGANKKRKRENAEGEKAARGKKNNKTPSRTKPQLDPVAAAAADAWSKLPPNSQLVCSLHQRLRTKRNMMFLPSGGYKCRPTKMCEIGVANIAQCSKPSTSAMAPIVLNPYPRLVESEVSLSMDFECVQGFRGSTPPEGVSLKFDANHPVPTRGESKLLDKFPVSGAIILCIRGEFITLFRGRIALDEGVTVVDDSFVIAHGLDRPWSTGAPRSLIKLLVMSLCLNPDVILVGHSVQNDLDAIGGSTMTWPSDRLCDTADLYKRTNGKRAKLEDVFKTVIAKTLPGLAHDPFNDSLMSLCLFCHYRGYPLPSVNTDSEITSKVAKSNISSLKDITPKLRLTSSIHHVDSGLSSSLSPMLRLSHSISASQAPTSVNKRDSGRTPPKHVGQKTHKTAAEKTSSASGSQASAKVSKSFEADATSANDNSDESETCSSKASKKKRNQPSKRKRKAMKAARLKQQQDNLPA